MKQDPDPRTTVLRFEDYRLDRRTGLSRCRKNGKCEPVILGSRALDVLHALLDQTGELVTKDQLMNAAWPAMVVEDANLTMQISALRRSLDAGRGGASCIQTVIGRGYRFLPDVTVQAIDTSVIPAPAATRSASGPPRLSIVVLPFSNLSDNREQQFLADGITVDLTTDLSRIRDALVISCNTAFTFRNKVIGTTQIARDLDVRFVLEGSVQRSGNQIRINAQLIDGVADRHVWAERFDRDIGDLMALQNEVVSRIAVELNLELITAEATRPAEESDVLDCVIRGRSLGWQTLSWDNYVQRICLYERACALDDRSVEAKSRLALVFVGRTLDLMTQSAAADIARAEVLVGQALAISPLSPIAHYAMGHLRRAQGRFADAIPEYETALASNRNWVAAIAFLGGSKFHVGFIDEVIPAQERAIRLSPRDPEIWIFYIYIGIAHLLRSRIDEAILWLERSRTCSLKHPRPNAFLASAYALKGESTRAQAYLAEARRLSGGRYGSISAIKAGGHFGVPEVTTLFERTFLAGLILAGVPDT
jgi:TolB-like protein/Tfp pilus assembly protein PilF